MPRFRFELDPVLRVRRLREQEKQRALAECEQARRDLEDRLRRHQENLAQGKEMMREAVVGRVDLAAMRGQAQASMQVQRRANEILLALAGAYQRIERARAELAEATRDRRAIELLRERRYAKWKADIEKAEIGFLDDLATSSAYRRDDSTC